MGIQKRVVVTLERDEAIALVEKLESDGALGSGDRMAALLRYLVTEEIEGRGERLKAFSIATDVFGRSSDFDPQTNSIVRVEVGRLRRSLELYFATTGRDASYAIVIEKGSYRPLFVPRTAEAEVTLEAEPGPAIQEQRRQNHLLLRGAIFVLCIVAAGVSLWFAKSDAPLSASTPANSIAVASIENHTGKPDLDTTASSLSSEMLVRLSRIKVLRVSPEAARGAVSVVQHRLTGEIAQIGDETRYVPKLVTVPDNRLIWSAIYKLPFSPNPADLSHVATLALFDMRAQIFASVRETIESRPERQRSPVDLFLLSTWFPGFAESSLRWERERVVLARKAVAAEPNFGPAHSVIAEKLSYLASIDPPHDTAANWTEARSHLAKAVQFASDDPDAMFNTALFYWQAGEMDESLRVTRRVLDLSPSHPLALFTQLAIPHTCKAAPQDVADQLVTIDAQLGRDNPIRWVTLGWLARREINQGNWEKSLDYARRSNEVFSAPETIHLMLAALVQLGEKERARTLYLEQKVFWPNLDARHYADMIANRRCKGMSSESPTVYAHRAAADSLQGPVK